MPLISVGRGKQTCEFQDSQGYKEKFYLKKGGVDGREPQPFDRWFCFIFSNLLQKKLI